MDKLGGMGLITPKVKASKAPLIMAAMVINTLDAERVLILNRNNGEKVALFKVINGNNLRILPLEYSASSDLAIIMFDDSGEFNAAVADNVQAIVVDIITLDINNPFPYEPSP